MAFWATVISALASIAGFGTWWLRAYVANKNAGAVQTERDAGADYQQVQANDAEMDRVTDAAAAANGVSGGQTGSRDPNDRYG